MYGGAGGRWRTRISLSIDASASIDGGSPNTSRQSASSSCFADKPRPFLLALSLPPARLVAC